METKNCFVCYRRLSSYNLKLNRNTAIRLCEDEMNISTVLNITVWGKVSNKMRPFCRYCYDNYKTGTSFTKITKRQYSGK